MLRALAAGVKGRTFDLNPRGACLAAGWKVDPELTCCGKSPDSADKEGMKSTAVQYSQPLTVAVSELARVSARHGVTAYALSLLLAAVTLLGSAFHAEIVQTFQRQLLGVRVATLWEAAFVVAALVWFAATLVGLLCLPQKGRVRSFGASSVGINLAAALLVACTLL